MAIPTQNMRTVTVATTILSLALTILAIGEDETAIALLYDTVGAGLHIFGLYSISKRYFWGIAALAGYLATRFIVYAVLVVVYVLPGAQASQRDLCHSLEPPGEPDLSCDQGLSTGFYVFQSILLLCMLVAFVIVSRFTFLFWKREASLYPEDRYQEHEGLGRRASVDTLPVYMPKPADIELHELPNYSSSVTIVTVDTSQSHSQDLDSNSAGQELAINSADNEHVRSSTGSVPVEPLDDVPLVPSVLSRRPQ